MKEANLVSEGRDSVDDIPFKFGHGPVEGSGDESLWVVRGLKKG